MNDYTAGKPWKIAKQQRILKAAYPLFSEKAIGAAAIPQAARAGLRVGQCPARLHTCGPPRRSKLRTLPNSFRHLRYILKRPNP